jgi:hypothetical protein
VCSVIIDDPDRIHVKLVADGKRATAQIQIAPRLSRRNGA